MIGVCLRISLLQPGELHKCNDILVSAHQQYIPLVCLRNTNIQFSVIQQFRNPSDRNNLLQHRNCNLVRYTNDIMF